MLLKLEVLDTKVDEFLGFCNTFMKDSVTILEKSGSFLSLKGYWRSIKDISIGSGYEEWEVREEIKKIGAECKVGKEDGKSVRLYKVNITNMKIKEVESDAFGHSKKDILKLLDLEVGAVAEVTGGKSLQAFRTMVSRVGKEHGKSLSVKGGAGVWLVKRLS